MIQLIIFQFIAGEVMLNATSEYALIPARTPIQKYRGGMYRFLCIGLMASLIGILTNGFAVASFPSIVHAALAQPRANGAVSTTWYFAEGRVGAGFEEFLTL